MITLVIGGSGSGKSNLAEDIAVRSGCRYKYYIATMVIMDDEGVKRVAKHRLSRKGKGFVTLELPEDVETAADSMENPKESVAVLECVTNLVGNLLFAKGGVLAVNDVDAGAVADTVTGKVLSLAAAVSHLIVVSGQYEPSDDDDDQTAIYKSTLDEVNGRLRHHADKVYDMNDTDIKNVDIKVKKETGI